MKRILISILTVALVGGAGFAATRAFFSDTETSVGNTFAAGAIDLKIDNTSYYTNASGTLVASSGTSWSLTDLTVEKFFNFSDLKPGDIGEDTISVHVGSNDAWLCAAARITDDSDQSCTDPEKTDDPTCTTPGLGQGELDQAVNFAFWVDDGDNVFETNETVFLNGPLSGFGTDGKITLADSQNSVLGATNPILGGTNFYIGKAWCFGTMTQDPRPDIEDPNPLLNNPIIRGTGFICNGSGVNNAAQTDQVVGDLQFYAVQSRNNGTFTCATNYTPTWITRIDRTQPGFGDGGWAGWSCPAGTTAVSGGIDSSTNPVGPNGVAAPGAPAVDVYTYPVYPHYTFPSGETGYVVRDLVDGFPNTISFHVDCQAN